MTNYINTLGKKAIGRREYRKACKGEHLTYKEAIRAQCYACLCGYRDGIEDCENPNCPLYEYMPYRHRKRGEVSEDDQLDLL